MKKFVIPVMVAALGLGLFGGCASSHEGAYSPKNTTVYDLENREKFVLMDSMVQASITCSGIEKKVNPDGRLEITAHVRNRETRRIQVQINCVFKDEHGYTTGDETPFQNLILTENSQEDVRFVAMNDKAKDFTIRVRQAH